MDTRAFSLVIPLWNEEKNIDRLIGTLAGSGLPGQGMKEAILVNNGSTDQTGEMAAAWSQKLPWVRPIHLKENLNYGGGVFEGLRHITTDIAAFIPGDLQVSSDDLVRIWQEYQQYIKRSGKTKVLFKGRRVTRHDPASSRLVSRVYTFLANTVLNLEVEDVNGLPKIFSSDLLHSLPEEIMRTFVFDAQLLYAARKKEWDIIEIPVTFYARREGISSWSQKRWQTYLTTLKQIVRLRRLKYP